jgi:hypothetical protein
MSHNITRISFLVLLSLFLCSCAEEPVEGAQDRLADTGSSDDTQGSEDVGSADAVSDVTTDTQDVAADTQDVTPDAGIDVPDVPFCTEGKSYCATGQCSEAEKDCILKCENGQLVEVELCENQCIPGPTCE